jgi:hypothetical protein
LQCNADLRGADDLDLWVPLAKALPKWITLAPSLCELSYPEEVRWVAAADALRCAVAESPSLHMLTFSPDFNGHREADVDGNLQRQLEKNLARLLRYPYGFFDPICAAFMGHLFGIGSTASNDIAQHVQIFVMGNNTPRDRWRALALLFVCRALCASAPDVQQTVVRLSRAPIDAKDFIEREYGCVTEGTIHRLRGKLDRF